MKRVGNIWYKIIAYENLEMAHKMARKDKTYYREVKMVDSNPVYYLTMIQRMLRYKTYKVSDYSIQVINDKGKERTLMKLKYYPDRIIQWAILLQLEKTFIKTFCSHTCASIPGRGNGKVIKSLNKYLRDEYHTKYCLQLDIKKFYDNVNHNILKELLRKKIKDPDVLWLLDLIIDSYPGDVGVPIGSYLSQYLANFYLCYLDHYIKEELRVKYTVRYMDDLIIFSHSKEELHRIFTKIEDYVTRNLNLHIKNNWQVYNVNVRGVAFVGYRYFRQFTLLSKKSAKRCKNLCLRILKKQNKKEFISFRQWCGINSYIGVLKPADTHRFKTKYLVPITESMLKYYLYYVKRSISGYNHYKNKLLVNLS